MSWYDYIPIVGSVTRLAKGDYKDALYDQLSAGSPTGSAIRYGGGAIVDKVKQVKGERDDSYDQAHHDLMDLAHRQRAFQMEGLNKAEGYFDPAQQRLNALYGPAGSFYK